MRGDGVVEDVDGDGPPKDRRVFGDDDDDISPSGREVPSAESLHRRAKVLLPKFLLEAAALRLESIPLFFYVKMTYIPKDGHRRWAEEATTHQGAPGGPGVPWCLVVTRWPPPVVICSSNSYILHKKSS